MRTSNVFNWRQISVILSGNPESVRSNYRGKKYNAAYNELMQFAERWIDKYSRDEIKVKDAHGG